jgi:hypothetical protein
LQTDALHLAAVGLDRASTYLAHPDTITVRFLRNVIVNRDTLVVRVPQPRTREVTAMTKKTPAPKPDRDKPDNPEWDAFDAAVRKIAVTPKPKPDKQKSE